MNDNKRLTTYNRVAALLAEFKPNFKLNQALESFSDEKLEETLQTLQQQQSSMYSEQDNLEKFLRD